MTKVLGVVLMLVGAVGILYVAAMAVVGQHTVVHSLTGFFFCLPLGIGAMLVQNYGDNPRHGG